APDDNHGLGDLFESQDSVGIDRVLDSRDRDAGRRRARGDDDVLRLRAIAVDGESAALFDVGRAAYDPDAVGLHETLDAVHQLIDHMVPTPAGCPEVEAESIGDHPEIGTALKDGVELRGLEHCLGRDAAADQASSTQPVLLDDGGARSELGGSDGGHVTAWTAADDGDIKALGHDSSFR